jgi:hypothetical protein
VRANRSGEDDPEDWIMMHYVLPYFPDTLPDAIKKYTLKYGDDTLNALPNGGGISARSPRRNTTGRATPR